MYCSLLSTVYAANFAGRYFANSSSLQTFMKYRYENLPTAVRYQGDTSPVFTKTSMCKSMGKGYIYKVHIPQNICMQTCTGEIYIMTAFVIHVSYKSVLCGGICTIESCLTLRMIKTQQNRSLNLNDNSVTSTITVHAAVNLVRGKAGNCPLPINYHSHVTCNLSMPIMHNSLIQHSMKYLLVYNGNIREHSQKII